MSAVLVVTGFLTLMMWWRTPQSHLKEGDIVFRGTRKELAVLTMSKWTHCGILHKENGRWVVIEACHGVEKTSLEDWRCGNRIFKVMRTRKKLTPEQQKAVLRYLQSNMGRSYDRAFRWSDDKMYCSELVWKAYHAAGIDLSKPRKAESFLLFKILGEKDRKMIMDHRGISMKDPMVAPGDLTHSIKLRRIL